MPRKGLMEKENGSTRILEEVHGKTELKVAYF